MICGDDSYRLYLNNFFWDLFKDESVKVSELQYDEFCELLNSEAEYIHSKNYRSTSSVFDDSHFRPFEDSMNRLFNIIDISITTTRVTNVWTSDGTAPEEIHFLLPSGETKTLKDIGDNHSKVEFCTQSHLNDLYAIQTLPFYLHDFDETDISKETSNNDGYGLSWVYDESSKILVLNGYGSVPSMEAWNYIGIPEIKEIYLNSPNINRFLPKSFAKDLIILDLRETSETLIYPTCCNEENTLFIYSDNIDMIDYNWKATTYLFPKENYYKTPIAYSYNENNYPKLPEWDKEKYPYAAIYYANMSGARGNTWVRFFSEPLKVSGEEVVIEKEVDYLTYILKDDEWSKQSEGTAEKLTFGMIAFPIEWSNHNILRSDNTVFLTTSIPVPVYE